MNTTSNLQSKPKVSIRLVNELQMFPIGFLENDQI